MKVRPVLLLVALLLLVPVPSVAAVGDAEVRLDLFLSVDTTRMTLSGGCGATVQADGRGFTFQEHDPAEGTGLDRGGWFVSGCGYARLDVSVPVGATSLHVSYFADRRIDTFGPEDRGQSIQGILFTDVDTGARIHDKDVYPENAGSREDRRHDSGAIPLPPGVRNASLEFYFRDVPPLGNQTGNLLGESLSGRSFSAYVHDIEILMHGDLLAPATVSSSTGREGTILLDELEVRLDVPLPESEFQPVPRILVDSAFDFERVVLPNGRTVDVARTWNGSLVGPGAVLVERTEAGLEITIHPDLVAEAGPGEYIVFVRATQSIRVSPVLLPVAVLLLASPLPFAVLAIVQAQGFYREAFGAYRLAARNLMIGVVGVFVYYVAVLASAFVGGRLDLMGVWPLPLEGVLLYVQVAAAAVAFVLLWLSARALYWITRPRPGTARELKD